MNYVVKRWRVCFKNIRNLFIWCQLIPHVNSVFLLSFCLCRAVISAEPCIITGHLGAVEREMSLQRQMTKPTVYGPAPICPRAQKHVNACTFSSYKPAPRRSLPSHLSWPQSRTRAVKVGTHTVKEQKNLANLTAFIIA